MITTLEKLFEESLKDLYNAEKQFLKGMSKLAKKATNPELKKGIEMHMTETEGHIDRLEKVAEFLEIKPTGKVCKAAAGLIEETQEHLEEIEQGPVLDAGIIVCAQKNEHYEICSYGTMIAWAKQLGYNDIIGLLEETLKEEKSCDEALTAGAELVQKNMKTASTPSKASVR